MARIYYMVLFSEPGRVRRSNLNIIYLLFLLGFETFDLFLIFERLIYNTFSTSRRSIDREYQSVATKEQQYTILKSQTVTDHADKDEFIKFFDYFNDVLGY